MTQEAPTLDRGVWLNEPGRWTLSEGVLEVVTDEATDFWRTTYYGFVRDNGHFLGVPVDGDFTAEVRVHGDYRRLYDQAGLMVRIDDSRWIKTGIEYSDGHAMLSTVVTNGSSDWSVTMAQGDARDVSIRVTMTDGALRVQASFDRASWPLLRLAPFPVSSRTLVGPTCCSPEGKGLAVRFSSFTIGPPTGAGRHDLS
jgi:regulation of enolase protein 1 (concanavalin A-like superfamily)